MIRTRLLVFCGTPWSWSGGLWSAPLQVNCAGIVPPEEKAELATEICAETERAAPKKQTDETSKRSRSNFIGTEVNPKRNSKPIKFCAHLTRKGRLQPRTDPKKEAAFSFR